MTIRGYLGVVGVTAMAAALLVPVGRGGGWQAGAAMQQQPAAAQAASTQPGAQAAGAPAAATQSLVTQPGAQAAAQPVCSADVESLERKLDAARQQMEEALEAKLASVQEVTEERLAKLQSVLEARRAELEDRAAELADQLSDQVFQAGPPQAMPPAPPMPPMEAMEDMPAMQDVQVFTEGSGWLGVDIEEVSAEKAKEAKLPSVGGVLVTEVEPDSPAAKAGLKAGDIVTGYNGERVEGTVQFRRLIRETPTGRAAAITVWRDGRSQDLSVQLGSRREQMDSRVRVFGPHDFNFRSFGSPGGFPGFGAMGVFGRPMLGVNAEDISGQLGSYFGVPGGHGILVEEVVSGSPAEKAGLKAGDVITKVDGEAVTTTPELHEKLAAKRDQKAVTLTVIRKGAEVAVPVELEHPKPAEHRVIARRLHM
jgi:serine protease Do